MEESKIRLPKEGEVLGVVEQMLGFDRLSVRCKDGHVRVCRIPGRLKKRMWMSEGDVVLVKPWIVQSDDKGDIVTVYSKAEVEILRKMKLLE